jgi:hypothetical protein
MEKVPRRTRRTCKGLGFFTYFTHVLNWRHPHAFTRQMLEIARPAYPQGDPRYQLTGKQANATTGYAHERNDAAAS